jgi:hypothetical protein
MQVKLRLAGAKIPVDGAKSFAYRRCMKSSVDHMPLRKQRGIGRILEILHEEFEDAVKEGTAEFKKRGRTLKISLFGSYAKGRWVDEPLTMKGIALISIC